MFKKNPNRPSINISLKKTLQGYRLIPNESYQLFTTKKIVRSIYRPDLIQMSNQNIEGVGNAGTLASGTMIQPPSHTTIPAVASWFKQDQVHTIEKEYFPQYFRQETNANIFSFSIKNSNLYMYYRNSMISMWRQNSKKYLSPSLCRKNLLGDVSSIMRIHAFLQNWGLINFPSKQHNKGIVISKPENIVCYVCQRKDSKSYFIAQIEDILFQICESCYEQDCYPQSIKKQQFKKIYYENHLSSQKQMDKNQIIRMLEIINGIPNGPPRDKDRDAWSVVQRQFPDISRQKILKTFLKIPLNVEMNSHIFENNQDNLLYDNQHIKKQIETITQPSVFQDFKNPILGSIANMFYTLNKKKQHDKKQSMQQRQTENIKVDQQQIQSNNQEIELYQNMITAAQLHSELLCKDQQQKIKNLTKMLIQVVLSRLELKSLFISEFEKLVHEQERMNQNIIKNDISNLLKQKMKILNSENDFINRKHSQQNQKEQNEVEQESQIKNQNNENESNNYNNQNQEHENGIQNEIQTM